MKLGSVEADSRTAWIVASAALAILTISYGAPLISVVALKPIAAELGTARSAPAAAVSLTYLGAAFGGIAAGWLSGWLGLRAIVIFGAAMLAAGLIISASGGLYHLLAGHGVLMGLFGTSCMALLWNITLSLVVEAIHDLARTKQLLARAVKLGLLVTVGGGLVLVRPHGFGKGQTAVFVPVGRLCSRPRRNRCSRRRTTRSHGRTRGRVGGASRRTGPRACS